MFRQIAVLQDRYFTLGRYLGLPVRELIKIQDGLRRDQDIEQAFIQMLLAWLRHSYRVEEYGPPTWRRLVEAVDRVAGGGYHELAKTLASCHPPGNVRLYHAVPLCRNLSYS